LMKYANNTSETIQRILQAIKEEALDPSKTEGVEIVAAANAESEQILFEANDRAKNILNDAQQKANDQIKAAKAEIELALKQARLQLKNDLTQNLFKKESHELISKEMHKGEFVGRVVNIILNSMEKEGLASTFEVAVPQELNERELVQFLSQHVREKIEKEGELKFISQFGGASLKIQDKNMVVELTENQIDTILDRFISDSLKAFIFND
ncbi:MAG: hypothetical protein ACOYK9_06680, partial [Chlamydiia bacterium]